MQDADEGSRIGMLLDLDQGSMTLWENGVRLGVVQAEGLSGPFCWTVELYDEGDSARIESTAPASLTEEELAAAKVWEHAAAAAAGSADSDEWAGGGSVCKKRAHLL